MTMSRRSWQVLEGDTLFLFFQKLPTCFCVSIQLQAECLQGHNMHIAIIVKISINLLALLLPPVSREQFRVCANRFEWHPATVLFVYSVLLSLPEQPPCLYLGLCRASVAATAADLLLRGTQTLNVLSPGKRERGCTDYFSVLFIISRWAVITPPPPELQQINTASVGLLLWLAGQWWSAAWRQ